jgi:hypothetical protein
LQIEGGGSGPMLHLMVAIVNRYCDRVVIG